jgi:hypothetical protein
MSGLPSAHVGVVEFALGLAARQQQVEQVVVGQVHQPVQRLRLRRSDRARVATEETFDEEVVLEQAAPAAPLELVEFDRGEHRVFRRPCGPSAP